MNVIDSKGSEPDRQKSLRNLGKLDCAENRRSGPFFLIPL